MGRSMAGLALRVCYPITILMSFWSSTATSMTQVSARRDAGQAYGGSACERAKHL
jgi:hypothetical protein